MVTESKYGWRREGYCSKCGRCCTSQLFSEEERRRYIEEGIKHPLITHDKCKYLVRKGNCYICRIYGQRKMMFSSCVDFPTVPEDIKNIPECTYRFIPLTKEEHDKIVSNIEKKYGGH